MHIVDISSKIIPRNTTKSMIYVIWLNLFKLAKTCNNNHILEYILKLYSKTIFYSGPTGKKRDESSKSST